MKRNPLRWSLVRGVITLLSVKQVFPLTGGCVSDLQLTNVIPERTPTP